MHIQHDAQVEPVFCGPNRGDIRDPFGIGRSRPEVSLQMITGPLRTGSIQQVSSAIAVVGGPLGLPTTPL
jgi:hypothetical protein